MITSILKNHPITVALNKCSGIVADLNTQQEALFFSNTTHEKTYLIVKPNLYQAQKLYQALYNLLKEDVVLLQCDESLRLEEIASSPETNASLIETLDYILNNKIKIIVTHIHAYLRYLPNPKLFKNSCITLQIEKEIKKQELENILLTSGYSKVMKVDQPLTFASRGSIIDIFSINYSNPIRIEFFDNNIESIRFFNIETQRTIQTAHTVNIIPATTLLLTPQEKQEIKDLIPKFPDFESQIEMFLDAQLDVKHYKFFALKSKHYHILDYLDCTTIFSNTELIQHNYEEYKIDTSLFLEEINFNTTHSLFF